MLRMYLSDFFVAHLSHLKEQFGDIRAHVRIGPVEYLKIRYLCKRLKNRRERKISKKKKGKKARERFRLSSTIPVK